MGFHVLKIPYLRWLYVTNTVPSFRCKAKLVRVTGSFTKQNPALPVDNCYRQHFKIGQLMKSRYLYQAIVTGWIAGMRSVSALAISTNLVNGASFFKPKNQLLGFLAKPSIRIAAYALTAAEMVGDKLPITPDRITPVPLTGRTLMGALSGAVIYSLAKRSPYTGAIIAGTTAVISSYAIYYLRKKIKEKTGAPDLLLGLTEDAIVLSQVIGTKKDKLTHF